VAVNSNPIRVLHLGNEMNWRGGENQIRLLVEGCEGKGIQNFLAYPKGAKALERFAKLVPCLSLPSRSPYDPRAWLALFKFCKKNQIHIIDAHSSSGHSLGLMLKRFLPDIKFVVHRRVSIPVKNTRRAKAKYLSPSVDHFVAISKSVAGTLSEAGVPTSKVSIVPSAIDVAVYSKIDRALAKKKLCDQHNLDTKTLLIGNASALEVGKGNHFLIQAVSGLGEKELKGLHIFIAGGGSQAENLRNLVSELKLENKVTFLGHIKEVPEFLSALDIMVLPSTNEGLGTILLDSIAAGAVVMASRCGGIPEIIKHQETGLLFEVGDVDSIRLEISSLIENAGLREKLANQARFHMEKTFSLSAMVAGNVQVYRSLV
jgi:L-malate glycosyltransferase